MSAKQLRGPTALHRHQQATKKGLRIKSIDEMGGEVSKIQPSSGSSKRSGEHKDDHGQGNLRNI